MFCLAYICMECMAVPRLAAQEAKQDTITGKVHQIDKVTVTARRMPAKVTSATPVQVLSQQDIHELGIQDMADAVRRFAGANVKDYGGIGGLKTVSVRNIGAAHTAVSYDGVAVSNCQAGQIDIGRFTLDNVSLLSLAIGQSEDMLQSAKLYGSAGILSIETEKPFFEEGKKAAFQVKVRGGSFGYVTPIVRWWQKLGSRTRMAVDANFMRADGNYPFTLVNGKYVTDEKRNNSDIYSWQIESALYHTFKDESELEAKAYYFYSERGLPGSVTLYNPIADERLWDRNAFVQARYKKTFSPQWSLQAQAKYNFGWNKYEDEGNEYSTGKYRAVHRQNEYYASVTALYQPAKEWAFSLAQDGAINTMTSTMQECPFPTRYASYTALNARYRLNWLTASATLLYTNTWEHVDEGTAPDNFHRFTPTFSVSIQPLQAEELYIRLMYKSTFRLPTFNDLYYFRIGNRTLDPEKAKEYNIGITWSKSELPIADYLSLTVDGYFNDVTDKIVAFPTTYAWKMANFGEVDAWGIDATLATAFSLSNDIKLIVSGSYTWQRAIDKTDPTAKNYKDQLPYTPRHSGSASAIVETPWLNVGYSMTGVSKRYYLSQNIEENEIDGYTEHTLSASHEFVFPHWRLGLQAEVVNLTDKQYDVIKYYPMPGRSWRVTGIIKF